MTQAPIIPQILPQHLEEAAFCWIRRQVGLWSPSFQAQHVRRFDLLLDAHLEGVRLAGEAAVEPALKALQKFLTPDEAFVSTYVLLHHPDPQTGPRVRETLEGLLVDHPELAPGAAAAFYWSTRDTALPLLRMWEKHEEGLLRRIALPGLVHHEGESAAFRALEHPATRARALRAMAAFGLQVPAMHQGLSDTDPRVRLEATLALALLGDEPPLDALPPLLQGLDLSTLRRALAVWGTRAPESAFEAWMRQGNPESLRMRIWAAAFRGDSAWIPFLDAQLDAPETAQLAAYALGHITGMDVDLDSLDLESQDENPNEEEDPQEREHLEDTGLLEPDPQKVRAWLKKRAPEGKGLLAGKPLDEAQAQQILATGWQPQRWQAAFHLARLGQPEALRRMADPAQEPYLYLPSAPVMAEEEDWKTAMMRNAREEEARQRALDARRY